MQTGVPRRARMILRPCSKGDGHASVSALVVPSKARCRAPPMMKGACDKICLAAGESPSSPSSPIPTIESQGLGAGSFRERSARIMLRVLILGGTSEANALTARLTGDARFQQILSLAGRTQKPRLPDIQYRIGGFGGV